MIIVTGEKKNSIFGLYIDVVFFTAFMHNGF